MQERVFILAAAISVSSYLVVAVALEPLAYDEVIPRQAVSAATTTEVSVAAPTTAVADNIYVLLQLAYALTKAGAIFSYLIGMYGLATSLYSVEKDCKAQYNKNDCILDSVSLVIATFQSGFKIKDGFGRKRGGNLDVHGIWTDPREQSRSAHLHIPWTSKSFKYSSINTPNNGTWERHATFFWKGEESHHLLYRQAVHEDLGFENDGSFHHYRVQDSDHMKELHARHENSYSALERRIEKTASGVVTDYLWKNGIQDAWNDFHDEIDVGSLETDAHTFLTGHDVDASCFTPIRQFGTHGGHTSTRIDNGILAYGWNNKAFNFDGRAGGWANKCYGSNAL